MDFNENEKIPVELNSEERDAIIKTLAILVELQRKMEYCHFNRINTNNVETFCGLHEDDDIDDYVEISIAYDDLQRTAYVLNQLKDIKNISK